MTSYFSCTICQKEIVSVICTKFNETRCSLCVFVYQISISSLKHAINIFIPALSKESSGILLFYRCNETNQFSEQYRIGFRWYGIHLLTTPKFNIIFLIIYCPDWLIVSCFASNLSNLFINWIYKHFKSCIEYKFFFKKNYVLLCKFL